MAEVLLIDIGNTRVKAALLNDDRIMLLPPAATRGDDAFSAWAPQVANRPARLVVSNVAGAEVAMHLARFARDRWQIEPEFAVPTRSRAGMTTRYREPHRLGVDRWLAALAAWRTCQAAVCVLDVGTALTVDVVLADGTHLGGLIAPGPELLRTSLTRGTAQLESDGISLVEGFADNTRDAISLGCTDALGGLFVRVAERLAHLAPGTEFRWYLTGGAAPLVAALLPVASQHVPDLVLRGLAVLAATSAP